MSEALQILNKLSAVLHNDHFVYKSGRHGSAYVNKDRVYPHTLETSRLAGLIAWEFQNDDVDVVVAPAVGGCILSNRVAEFLTTWNKSLGKGEVLGIYADKEGNDFVIKREYDEHIPGKRVLVVEDVLTTGNSAMQVVNLVRSFGGQVIGLGALCNRGGITREALGNVPRLKTLVDVTLESYSEEECPLCKDGVPVNTTVGH